MIISILTCGLFFIGLIKINIYFNNNTLAFKKTKKIILFFLTFLSLPFFGQNGSDFEKKILSSQSKIHVDYLNNDKFKEAITLLEVNEKKLEGKNNYYLECVNYNLFAISYAQIAAYERAENYYLKSINAAEKSNRPETLERILLAKVNLLNLFLDTKQFKKFNNLESEIKREALKKYNRGIFYYYQTKLRFFYFKKRFVDLIAVSNEALNLIEDESFINKMSKKNQEFIVKYKERFITIYDLFRTYAYIENNRNIKKAKTKLDFYINKDLKEVLYVDEYLWFHEKQLYFYKTKYFLKYNYNKDSINNSVDCFEKQSTFLNNYLRGKKKNSNEFLLKSIDNEVALEKKNSRLKLEYQKAEKRKNLVIFILVLLILSLFFAIKFLRDKREKEAVSLKLIKKNNELIESVNKREKLEKNINKLENIQLNLNKKNKEVLMQLEINERKLFSKQLKISTNKDNINRVLENITSLLKSDEPISQNMLLSAEKNLKMLSEEELIWDDFKIMFEKINPNFFTKLKKVAPDLSINELKHCTYIVAKLKTKDVANLINVSPRSVETARYRIKKKINLNKEQSLYDYLQNI